MPDFPERNSSCSMKPVLPVSSPARWKMSPPFPRPKSNQTFRCVSTLQDAVLSFLKGDLNQTSFPFTGYRHMPQIFKKTDKRNPSNLFQFHNPLIYHKTNADSILGMAISETSAPQETLTQRKPSMPHGRQGTVPSPASGHSRTQRHRRFSEWPRHRVFYRTSLPSHIRPVPILQD